MLAPEAPVEHSGHVFSRAEIPPQCGFVEVEEWVLTGLSRQREQVCSEGWPRRLAGERRGRCCRLGRRACD